MIDKTQLKQQIDENYTAKLFDSHKFVYGEGNTNSKIVFIGEAPGSDEEKQGRPFVGKAGKNLTAFLDGIGMERNDIYITNAVKFRPTNQNIKTNRLSNRTPTTAEILLYRDWLKDELKIIQPSLVVTLGNTPLFSVTNDKSMKITQVHGMLITQRMEDCDIEFTLMPFYHPAAIIYRRELTQIYLDDMQKFKQVCVGMFGAANKL